MTKQTKQSSYYLLVTHAARVAAAIILIVVLLTLGSRAGNGDAQGAQVSQVSQAHASGFSPSLLTGDGDTPASAGPATLSSSAHPTPLDPSGCSSQWQRVPSPNGPDKSELRSVTVISQSDAWAVGYYGQEPSNGRRTLIMHWDGGRWSIVPSPNVSTVYNNVLYAVAAISSTDVWAVGSYYELDGSGHAGLLTMHWNGQAWRIESSPNPSPSGPFPTLYGVTAISSTDVWAVGTSGSAGAASSASSASSAPSAPSGSGVITMHWNGQQWSIAPNPVEGEGTLYGVTAFSSTDVWAVGSFGPVESEKSLTLHWNGAAWSIVFSPSPYTGNILYGVATVSGGISPGEVWAVGDAGSSLVRKSLIMRWDGTAWNLANSENAGSYTYMRSVTTGPSNEVRAAGYFYDTLSRSFRSLVERWDGATWTIERGPIFDGDYLLYGIASVPSIPSVDVWAVGSAGLETLVERLQCEAPPTPPPSVTRPPVTGTPRPGSTSTFTSTPVTPVSTLTAIPCVPGAFGFVVDDGSMESNVGHGAGGTQYAALWLNRSPVDGPQQLDTISIVWPSPAQARGPLVGRQVRLLVYYDADADGDPSNAALVHQSLALISVADGVTFQNYPLTAGSAGIPGRGDIYVGFEDVWAEMGYSPRLYPAPIDQSRSQRRSWFIGSYGPLPNIANIGANNIVKLVDDLGVEGNWMIRAHSVRTCAGAPTQTRPPTLTPIPGCGMQLTDAHPSDWFYNYVEYLYCRSVLGGYNSSPPCDTGAPCFKPNNSTTRGQTAKIVLGALNLPAHTEDGPHFSDVPENSAFYRPVETARYFGVIAGYGCGGPGEPCDSQNRPYFRPNVQVTRAQITKMVVLSAAQADPANWQIDNPQSPSFADVPLGSTFYGYIEAAARHGVLGGYPCGGPGEGCDGSRRPYFRPGNNATRAQIAKIINLAVSWSP